jgi:hypothetical protein
MELPSSGTLKIGRLESQMIETFVRIKTKKPKHDR